METDNRPSCNNCGNKVQNPIRIPLLDKNYCLMCGPTDDMAREINKELHDLMKGIRLTVEDCLAGNFTNQGLMDFLGSLCNKSKTL